LVPQPKSQSRNRYWGGDPRRPAFHSKFYRVYSHGARVSEAVGPTAILWGPMDARFLVFSDPGPA
jgi:hypothetical protein